MEDRTREDDDAPPERSLMIFGRDVSKIPCFRNSFLYGISGGIGSGLTYFMFTSRPQGACHFGMMGFTLITLGYWTRCRFRYSQMKFEMLRVQELIRKQNMYEGTQLEKEVEQSAQLQDV